MQLHDFYYNLPQELIARFPLPQRTASKLLCLANDSDSLTHRTFSEIGDLLRPGDLLVFNNTKVLPARLLGHKKTGGRVEVLVERLLDQQRFSAQARASKALRIGEVIFFEQNIELEIVEKEEGFYVFKSLSAPILEIIESIGQIPLPPYLNRLPEESDKERYQTVYAEHKGSVAAPTAGLHFDAALLKKLQALGIEMAYVTLHIGAGTFIPVRSENIKDHKMHAEYMEISAELCTKIKNKKAQGKRIIAVGTTTVRVLETASQHGEIAPFAGDTCIFIYPGYQFKTVDALITNLHLPGSTLLMLVSAFAGQQKVMRAYEEAVKQRYRFFSYGDAMWMTRE